MIVIDALVRKKYKKNEFESKNMFFFTPKFTNLPFIRENGHRDEISKPPQALNILI